jgi:hypothetical protein
MAKLDLYSGREPHIVEVEVGGEKRTLKLPTDFTVEEIERFYEIESELAAGKDKDSRYAILSRELHLLLKRYQADITLDEVRRIPLPDVLKIMDFVSKHNMAVAPKSEDLSPSKKKARSSN